MELDGGGIVTNSNSIAGNTSGIYLTGGGSVTNTGTLTGGSFGVLAHGVAATLTNQGRLSGGTTDGIYLAAGGLVSNLGAASSLAGGQYGVFSTGGVATVQNAGTIAGTHGQAIHLVSNVANRVIFDPGAVFDGAVYGGSGVLELASAGSAGTLTGFGSQFTRFSQITIDGGANWAASGGTLALSVATTLNNAAGALLSGEVTGPATVINAGTITGSVGAYLGFGVGNIVNNASGLITGNLQAVRLSGDGGTINNAGTLTSARYAAAEIDSGGVISNSGSIFGHSSGVYLNATGIYRPTQIVTNTGIVAGNTYGVLATGGAATVVNAGTITGSGGTAVSLPSGFANRVVFDPNAVFDGTVQGGGGVLELGAGSAATLSGLGSEFANFSQVSIDSGASWMLASGVSIASGVTLGISGTLVGAATLRSGALLSNVSTGVVNGQALGAGSVVNSGKIQNASGAGVYLSGGNVSNNAAGLISGTSQAIRLTGGGVVNNAGTLVSSLYSGIEMDGGGGVTNTGRINGNTSGIYLTNGGNVSNTGSVSGVSYGVLAKGGATTVVNAGTLSGNGGAAISLATGFANRVMIDPGAAFSGNVLGGGGVLELASGSGSGTLSGLGTLFTGFGQIAVDAHSHWTLSGANTIASGTTLSVTDATFTASGALVNNGQIVIDPSSMTVASLGGVGTETIGANSTLDVLGSISSGQTIVFADNTGVLQLGDPIDAAGTIAGFVQGDTIDLTNVAHQSNDTATLLSGNTLEIVTGSGTFDLRLSPTDNFTGDFFHLGSDGGSGSAVTQDQTPCFLRGTRIRTDRGDIAVEALSVGDRVVTLSGETRPITWIGTGYARVTPAQRNAATPIVVRKCALADNVPHHDLYITKGHSLFIDGVLIPAEFLVNHRSILWDDRASHIEFYHIEVAQHDVLIAEGAPAETYRDDGNRWLFANANSGWSQPPKPPCAPVLTGGPVVDEVWRRLLERSGPRPGLPLTDDPDLHLLADGQRIDPVFRRGDMLVFRLRSVPRTLRIASRAAAPAEIGLARDPRLLGVALRQIAVRHGPYLRVINADDAALVDGFHAYEPECGHRWTTGDAAIPAGVLKECAGEIELVLHLAGRTRYVEEARPCGRLPERLISADPQGRCMQH